MQAVPKDLPDIVEIRVKRHADHRGHFSETYRKEWFRNAVPDVCFVQENESLTRKVGVIRGLHYQKEPVGQGKLVRCIAGSIFDVAVDVRAGSPTYGRWVSAVLSGAEGNQLWIPAGFLHGFCTLEPDTIVCYKVTNYYSPEHDAGVAWDDPDIGITWPDVADVSLMSAKDKVQPKLAETAPMFAIGAT